MNHKLTITVHPELYSICRLEPEAAVPQWAAGQSFLTISRTKTELSIVCEDARVPQEVHAERNRRLMQVAGTLAFSLTGILAAIAVPLAEAHISIFGVSTYDTDYVLVQDADLEHAISALESAGHAIQRISPS
ncbi:MAG: ACT domain-containing protein [Acidobacteria bacterium]|nr:ACT domain-containing protein [Acidobacteriota bacterium]MBS1867765.1 ACT domain-containing protein [Acidobacteriota bacterium]